MAFEVWFLGQLGDYHQFNSSNVDNESCTVITDDAAQTSNQQEEYTPSHPSILRQSYLILTIFALVPL